jgi:hypothetical protein
LLDLVEETDQISGAIEMGLKQIVSLRLRLGGILARLPGL